MFKKLTNYGFKARIVSFKMVYITHLIFIHKYTMFEAGLLI